MENDSISVRQLPVTVATIILAKSLSNGGVLIMNAFYRNEWPPELIPGGGYIPGGGGSWGGVR